MQVTITAKHIDLSNSIEEYARSKAEKLTRYYDRTEQINVKIEKTTHGFIIEIICDVEHHNPIVATSEENDVYAAIDGCIDKSVRQLTDLKSKTKDHKYNTPTGGQER